MTAEPNALIAIGRHPQTAPLLGALLQALDGFADYELTPGPGALHIVAGVPFVEVVPEGVTLLLRLFLPGRLANARVIAAAQRPDGSWANAVRVGACAHLDAELTGWLEQAYTLAVMAEL